MRRLAIAGLMTALLLAVTPTAARSMDIVIRTDPLRATVFVQAGEPINAAVAAVKGAACAVALVRTLPLPIPFAVLQLKQRDDGRYAADEEIARGRITECEPAGGRSKWTF